MTPQCPNRGPGLGHISRDGFCEYCGIPSHMFFAADQLLRSTSTNRASIDAVEIRKQIEAPRVLTDRIEPKMATGQVTGPAWGRGRGPITPRQTRQLEFLVWLENAGVLTP